MASIRVLPEHLSNKIAAGEVVERPASIVKELVENAIDAGSRRIFVSIQKGGIEGIEVSDDGEGMLRDEALLAFQRHATSKIATEDDLASILSLGFRGEALPSIASISKLRLVTRPDRALEGSEIQIEGGEVRSVKAIGAPRGSSFSVKDLFYNVPARRKFLKTEQTELGHISRLLYELALPHDRIHFRLSHGGRSLLDLPPCSTLKERLSQLFGAERIAQSLAVNERTDEKGFSLEAFLSNPPLKKNFKKAQHLFVNRRAVKSALLNHAVYEAYGRSLMKGEAPFFVLSLTVDPAEVDVNVHPTKREVRFQNTAWIHQAVRNVLREALSSQRDFYVEPSDIGAPALHPTQREGSVPNERQDAFSPSIGWPGFERQHAAPQGVDEQALPYGRDGASFAPGISSLACEISQSASVFPSSTMPMHGIAPLIRPLGQVYGTFLLAEIDGVLAVVDQHTAHERILYEAFLKARRASGGSEDLEIQPFLIPQQIDLPLSQASLLKDHLDSLAAMGCRVEAFGETTFLVRELPALIVGMNLEGFLHDLTEDLENLGLSGKAEQVFQTIIASMACHGAVRAHQAMSLPEIAALLLTYFERRTPVTCPHGRPIVMTYPLSDLEKLFRRK